MARILVCDDADDLRLLIRITLQSAGHEVVEADGGVEVPDLLDDATAVAFDALVLDVQMPIMDGWSVLRHVRSHERYGDLPVLMCTVKFSDADLSRAWQLGCDGYLNKPFDLDALTAGVEGILDNSTELRVERRRSALAAIRDAQPAAI